MNSFTLLQKLLALCVIALIAIATAGAFGMRSVSMGSSTARLAEINGVQRAQMESDMMHDGLRADVLALTLGVATHDDALREEGISGVAEHVERFRKNMKICAADSDPGVQAAVKKVAPEVERYLHEAEAFAAAAGKSNPTLPSLGEFQSLFSSLEGGMEQFGDTIAGTVERLGTEAAAAESSAERGIIISAVLGALVMIGFSIVVVRAIRRPLDEMARAARAIAQGDVQQSVDYMGKDEIGDLARALREMIEYLQELAFAAQGLGRGDLSIVIRPRSEHDTLSSSFERMKQSLTRLVGEGQVVITGAQKGQLSTRGSTDGLEGAFGQLIEGMNAVLAAVNAPIQEAKSVLESAQRRDLTARMNGQYAGDYDTIKTSMNGAFDALEGALSELTVVADQISAATREITAGASVVAHGSASQAASIDEVVNTLTEMTGMSQRTADNAQRSREYSRQAMTTAEQGAANMSRLSSAVGDMKHAADETAEIIRTIDEFAFQTNLLALNAAVEAARAGDAGRGFSVVAEEVRSLALRSAEAARNTSQVIERSLQKAGEGVTSSHAATVAFEAIGSQIKSVVEVITDIADSSKKQHDGVARIHKSVDAVSHATQQGAATSEQSASACDELSAQVEMMRSLTGQFRVGRGQRAAGSRHAQTSGNPHGGVRITGRDNETNASRSAWRPQ